MPLSARQVSPRRTSLLGTRRLGQLVLFGSTTTFVLGCKEMVLSLNGDLASQIGRRCCTVDSQWVAVEMIEPGETIEMLLM